MRAGGRCGGRCDGAVPAVIDLEHIHIFIYLTIYLYVFFSFYVLNIAMYVCECEFICVQDPNAEADAMAVPAVIDLEYTHIYSFM